MVVWPPALPGILEQEGRSLGCPWRMRLVRIDHDDHPIYARRLGGVGRRLPRNDGKSGLSDEGLRPTCSVFLFAEAGFAETVDRATAEQHEIRSKRIGSFYRNAEKNRIGQERESRSESVSDRKE